MGAAYCQYCGKGLPLGSDAMTYHEKLFCDFVCVSSYVSDEVDHFTYEGEETCEHCGAKLSRKEIAWYIDSTYCNEECIYSAVLDEIDDHKITEEDLDYEDGDW